jgi:hypothetical protein
MQGSFFTLFNQIGDFVKDALQQTARCDRNVLIWSAALFVAASLKTFVGAYKLQP